MSANVDPIFTLIPVISSGSLSSANTARDGTGEIVTIITGATNGTRIGKVTVQATNTTTAGMVRLFIGNSSGSPIISLWKEIPVTALTGSGSVPEFSYILLLTGEEGLILPENYTLRASTHNAETFNVIAEGGNY